MRQNNFSFLGSALGSPLCTPSTIIPNQYRSLCSHIKTALFCKSNYQNWTECLYPCINLTQLPLLPNWFSTLQTRTNTNRCYNCITRCSPQAGSPPVHLQFCSRLPGQGCVMAGIFIAAAGVYLHFGFLPSNYSIKFCWSFAASLCSFR